MGSVSARSRQAWASRCVCSRARIAHVSPYIPHAALHWQAASSREEDNDTRSTTSSSSSRGQQRAARAATIHRSRGAPSGAARGPRKPTLDLASMVDDALEKAASREQTAQTRRARSDRRASGDLQPPAVGHVPSMVSEGASLSPMSASDAPEHPTQQGALQLPEPLGEDSSSVHSAAGEPLHPGCAADYDSSDEEGARTGRHHQTLMLICHLP